MRLARSLTLARGLTLARLARVLALALLAPLSIASCAPQFRPAGPAIRAAAIEPYTPPPQPVRPSPWALVPGPPSPQPTGPVPAEALVMPDGARLALRVWAPATAPRAVLLMVHGFGDHGGNSMLEGGPLLNAAGVLVYAYDQRGFGYAPHHGIWAGTATLTEDVRVAARLIAARHPGVPLFLLGESLGGAVAILAGMEPSPQRGASAFPQRGASVFPHRGASDFPRTGASVFPTTGNSVLPGADASVTSGTGTNALALPVRGIILSAPALFGRSQLPRVANWILDALVHLGPGMAAPASAGGISPSDNAAAVARFGRDPLILRNVRLDLVGGLMDAMDAALEALPRCCAVPTLILTGGRDEVIPTRIARRVLRDLPPRDDRRILHYPEGWHLLLRDTIRPQVAQDIIAWMDDARAPLAAEAAAGDWLR